ncbi:mitochondrial ribosomal subunit protein-domain-containing protein [Lineolata rhizophorae]|uniref:Mitochondrial ribosomal subunit protein-domain-containing protein n=1 Tax=Lineolata rhizophorae TaxID=578093 RepID=A0A6A6P368_9PEZI|nr:mitochondrial ribosomal subunit protein-domain-containing protein [Lineolata rhizophorae]
MCARREHRDEDDEDAGDAGEMSLRAVFESENKASKEIWPDKMSQLEALEELGLADLRYKTLDDADALQDELQAQLPAIRRQVDQLYPTRADARPQKVDDFWHEGDQLEPGDEFEDDAFDHDDISSLAHGELERQREVRELMRVAAWEMPLLGKLAKEFQPPTAAEPLRFRYTTYLGEEHPAARKIVVEFCPGDLPDLTRVQRDKLIKLCGARYNPQTEIVRMSSDAFETAAQNKRYLGDMVLSLLREARDPADTFEDVPFDFRHHKPKLWHAFPKQWLMTEERKKELDQRRTQRYLAEVERIEKGTLVDGARIVAKHMKQTAAAPEPSLMEMVGQRRLGAS